MQGLRLFLALAQTAAFAAGCASTSPRADAGAEPAGNGSDVAEELQHLLQELDRTESAGAGTSGTTADYRIGPQDLLQIVVFDAPELSQDVRVSSQGDIALPLIGAVPASGSTAQELAAAIEARLGEKYMRDPHVAVQITETRARSVYVLGEVNRPGSFEVDDGSRTTVLQALAMGGGLSPLAARSRAVLIRTAESGSRTHIPIDLDRALKDSGVDEPMLPNDILFVPRSTPRSVIRGVFGTITRIITFRGIF